MAANSSNLSAFLGKSNNRKIIVGVVVISIAVHLLGGIGAAVWIVAQYFQEPQAVFESRKIVAIPPKIIDPKLASAEFEAAMSKPTMDLKMMSLRETEFALPDVPMAPAEDTTEFDPSALIESQVDASAIGFGAGAGSGGGGSGSGFSFFGVSSSGSRIVFVLDISGSMVGSKNGIEGYIEMENEVEKALRQLQSPTEFNIIVFGGVAKSFSQYAQKTGTGVVDKAMAWLKSNSPIPIQKAGGKYGGTIHAGTETASALELAFKMEPDVIVLLSDGEPQMKNPKLMVKLEDGSNVTKPEQLIEWVSEQQKNREDSIQINTIAYKNGGTKFMEPLAERNKGTFRAVD